MYKIMKEEKKLKNKKAEIKCNKDKSGSKFDFIQESQQDDKWKFGKPSSKQLTRGDDDELLIAVNNESEFSVILYNPSLRLLYIKLDSEFFNGENLKASLIIGEKEVCSDFKYNSLEDVYEVVFKKVNIESFKIIIFE